MKYYLIAGERSGDLHASNLMKQLKQQDPDAEFRYYGGDLMQAQGGTLVRHYSDMAFMGVWEVIKNLRKISGFIKECKADLLEFKPDVIIHVDYSGFNMKIAPFAKANGFKTYYYIAPKVWAWNQKRALKIKKYIDRLFCILPFEKEFFKKYDYEVDYVGNPVMDAIADHSFSEDIITEFNLKKDNIIAVLPGSRKQEIEKMLDFMLSVSPELPDYEFVVAAVPNFPKEYFEAISSKYNIKVVYDRTYDLLYNAKAAVVTSGTATLETALIGTPQVVCYKTSGLSYYVIKAVIKVDFVSLVNLIAGREVVKELIYKHQTKKEVLVEEIKQLMTNESYRDKMVEGYRDVKKAIGVKRADKITAGLIHKYLVE